MSMPIDIMQMGIYMTWFVKCKDYEETFGVTNCMVSFREFDGIAFCVFSS